MNEPPLVLEGATLIDGTSASRVLRRAAIVVEEGRISAVGRAGQLAYPEHAEVRQLNGRTIVPGLIDLHVHALDPWVLSTSLAMGVTTLRDPARPVLPPAMVTDSDTGADRADCAAPRVLSAGPPLDHPPADPRAVCVATEADTRREVRRQADAGVDFIKLYIHMPPALVRAAVDEAHASGLKVIGDLVQTSWTEGARAGIDFLCHAVPRHPSLLPAGSRESYQDEVEARREHPICRWLELVDLQGEEIEEMICALREHEVKVDPTLVSLEALLFTGDPDFHARLRWALSAVPEQLRHTLAPDPPAERPPWFDQFQARARAAWHKALGLIQLLHENRVTLLAGTDAPRSWVFPGASLHRELALLCEAGLSPMEVLIAATSRAASALGLTGQTGSVESGKAADLVVLRGDPLAEIANTAAIEWVMRSGVIIQPADGPPG